MVEKLTLIAVGDVLPNRDRPESLFDRIVPILRGSDITFGQIEASFSERGTCQLFMLPGLKVHPRNVAALTYAGFNIVSFASNHALDWSDDALLDTLDVLRENDITVIGAGKNIDEARQPAILERKGTKVGCLAYCSVVPPGFAAGQDKPGVAPLRVTTSYEQVDWQPGAPPHIISRANPDDLAAMVDDIKKLRPSVDVLMVSMHWGIHFVPSIIAMYQYEVGHAAIDAGADIIIGHHAHILKGIEVYKGKVIFFSLCNFAFDHPVERVKSPFHNMYGRESDPEYPTYDFPADSRKTILVKCTIADGKIERVAFLPLMINKQGQPEVMPRSDKRSDEVYQYMEWLCKDQKLNVRFSREGDEVVVLT